MHHVMVDGAFVVQAGKLRTIDYSALRADVARLNDRVHDESQMADALVRQLEGVVGEFCGALAQKPYHVHRFVGIPGDS